MEKFDSDRVVKAARIFCDTILPTDFEKELGEGISRGDLFKITPQVGTSAILLEVESSHNRVKSLLIGKGGNNIRAISNLCDSIAKQEGFRLFDISVSKNNDFKKNGKR